MKKNKYISTIALYWFVFIQIISRKHTNDGAWDQHSTCDVQSSLITIAHRIAITVLTVTCPKEKTGPVKFQNKKG